MFTNCERLEPVEICTRWSSAAQKHVDLPQPGLIESYNSTMGGGGGEIDQMDQAINIYSIKIRNKKNYWPLIAFCIEVFVCNAWLTLAGPKHFTRISKIMAHQTRNVSLWAFV